MAIKANLVIDQGTSFSADIDLSDSNDNVFNLTDYTVFAQMRKNYASSIAVSFITSHNNSGGKITLGLAPLTTGSLEPGRYLYDVEIVSIGGVITRVVEGIATVTPGITRV